MIDFEKIILVNYCYPDCTPLMNIMRLPKSEAFKLAEALAKKHPETTAFYRFADFDNYYALRKSQDRYLYDKFVCMGGRPEEAHPLSFVVMGSEYLSDWFGNGIETKILLSEIDPSHISFTLGDSGAEFEKSGCVELINIDEFRKLIDKQEGDYNDFLNSIGKHYVEVQVWSDKYFHNYLL